MDDELKLRIAASLDRASDAEADAEVVRAMSEDPSVEAWARGVHQLDEALRAWPAVRRGEKSWGRLADKIRKRVEGAKGRASAAVTASDDAFTAAPVFDDDAAPTTEQQINMSETHDHDADLEGLAALTRTSQIPGAMPSVPPRSLGPTLLDEPDDTSSGLVDMKSLAQLTREAAASSPPPAPVEPAAESQAPPAKAAQVERAAAPAPVKVTPAPSSALPDVDERPRKGGNTWLGALGGFAVAAVAFFVVSNNRSENPAASSISAADPGAPTATPAAATTPPPPEAPAAAAPSLESAPTPSAPPEPAPAAAPPAEAAPPAPAEPSTAQAAPPPAPSEAPRAAHPSAAPSRSRAERSHEVAHAPTPSAATGAAAAPTPAPSAPAAPAAARAATPTPARPAAPAAAPASVDDLINRVAGGSAPAAQPAATPAAAAAPALPERLTRPQVASVMGRLNSAVRACAQGQTGTAPVALVIGNDGNVRSANVSGQFAGTPAGECIAGVVRGAHFPQFRAPQATLTWPFVILPPR